VRSPLGSDLRYPPRVTDAVQRIKSVFLEIPGTQLNASEAARLSGVDVATCRIILETLEKAQFVARSRGEVFVRRSADSPR